MSKPSMQPPAENPNQAHFQHGQQRSSVSTPTTSSTRRIAGLLLLIAGGLTMLLALYNGYSWLTHVHGARQCDLQYMYISDLAQRAESIAVCKEIAGEALTFATTGAVLAVVMLVAGFVVGRTRRAG